MIFVNESPKQTKFYSENHSQAVSNLGIRHQEIGRVYHVVRKAVKDTHGTFFSGRGKALYTPRSNPFKLAPPDELLRGDQWYNALRKCTE